MGADRGTTQDGVYEQLFSRALELMYSDIEPEPGFHRFINECSDVVRSPVWDSLRRLDIPSDLRHIESWLSSLFEEEPPEPQIRGLYFGISDPFVGVGYELYLCGSSRYDSADVDFAWAVNPDYWPEGRYSKSGVFHALWTPSGQRQLPYQLADDAIPLVYAGLVANWLSSRMSRVVLGNARLRAIAVGHDEGDAYLLGIVDADGYHKSSLRATLEAIGERERQVERFVAGLERGQPGHTGENRDSP